MRIGPFELSVRRAETREVSAAVQKNTDFVTRIPPTTVGWWPVIRESFAGAWQRSLAYQSVDVLMNSTVWGCGTLIACDIAKLCIDLRQENETTGISAPVNIPAFSNVLSQPNHFQNRINFIESWILSKVLRGNAYVLKQRDRRGVVSALYVLDPLRVKPLVAPNGQVYYSIQQDYLAGVQNAETVFPAREVIHDRWNTLYHPLVGLSPIVASGLAAVQSLKTQNQSLKHFANGSQISGILTTPTPISAENAQQLQENWEKNYAGEDNAGKIAVLGGGMKFVPNVMTAVDSQLVEQLKWSDEKICSTFHVPAYMVGVGAPPNYNNIEALNQQYYSQCLQILIEALELCLEEGLGASDAGYEIEADIDALLRMDSANKMKAATDGVRGGIYTPNEARAMFNKAPIEGGNTVYLQEQDHSLQWLSRRDAQPIEPPTPPPPAPSPAPQPTVHDLDPARVLAKTLERLKAA